MKKMKTKKIARKKVSKKKNNINTTKSNWNSLKKKISVKWAKFTDSDLEDFKDDMERIGDQIQKTYGYSKKRAKQEYDLFIKNL